MRKYTNQNYKIVENVVYGTNGKFVKLMKMRQILLVAIKCGRQFFVENYVNSILYCYMVKVRK